MTQGNLKAFAVLTHLGIHQESNQQGDAVYSGQAFAQYVLLDSGGAFVQNAGGEANGIFGYSDNLETIHESVAAGIRSQRNDESIVVIFLDSPGRY